MYGFDTTKGLRGGGGGALVVFFEKDVGFISSGKVSESRGDEKGGCGGLVAGGGGDLATFD